MAAKTYTYGNFDNDTNNFFYFTYNNVSDFSSGYSTSTVLGQEYYDISPVQVVNNYTSPFEFIDEVEIEEMNFLLYTKYVYYSISNKKTGKKYHGVLDTTLNKVMFNIDEDLDLFIPYSKYSMLAITKESAYEICIIKDDSGNCIKECTSGNIKVDIDGNKCDESCGPGKYLIVPEGVCSSECDLSIYIQSTENNYCGLCRDLGGTKKYKIINGTECLESIPEGAKVLYPDLYLLVCDSGYILNNSICSPHCYESCEKCSDYSTNEDDQKCLS